MAYSLPQFEQLFAQKFGFPGAVATGFGRSAIALALREWNVAGREVLVPSKVCTQVVQAIRVAGGVPVYYPVEENLGVCLNEIVSRFTSQTAAAIAVHYYGRLLDSTDSLANACKIRGIRLLEDCAHVLGESCAGHAGDAAIFSFTKSDWCYGGGVLSSELIDFLNTARRRRDASFRQDDSFARRYGILRRIDFAANRPSLARRAEVLGRRLNRELGFGAENFFDAAPFDEAMCGPAVRRARHQMENLRKVISRRRNIVEILQSNISESLLLHLEAKSADTFAYLVLKAPADVADNWVQRAAAKGVTLRHEWTFYQQQEPAQAALNARHSSRRLLILEIHPQLDGEEIQQIREALRGFTV